MKIRSIGLSALIAAGILLAALFPSACRRGPQAAGAAEDSLLSVIEEYWNHRKSADPLRDILEGKNIRRLPDISLEKVREEAEFSRAVLEKLARIPSDRLSHARWIDYQILKWQLESEIAAPKYYRFTFFIPPVSGLITTVNGAYTGFRFESSDDLRGYMDLLAQYPEFIGTVHRLTREQMEKDIVLPREMFPIVESFLPHILAGGEDSPFFVGIERLKGIEAAEVEPFQTAVLQLVDEKIIPEIEAYAAFLKGNYFSRSPDKVGYGQYPGGEEYYRHLIRLNTTLDMTPEEIHRVGLEEVAKIEARVEKIKRSLGFAGTLAEFRRFLKTDARFFPRSPGEIEEKLMSYVAGMDARIPEYFSAVPKAPYGVRRLAPELEGSMTFGYYQVPTVQDPRGYYLYNGSKLEERSLLMAEGLIYHELVPGHHFHIASQMENEEIPEFRRYFLPTAFNEGWAEYAAWLGLEMGLFEDPYSLIGRHMLDMMLAVRLVVDTGMNALGWTRAQAVEFMKEHMIESDTQIYTESLRYSVRTPAQALGYKLGSIKMMELREKAESELGERFDIKKFHRAVLGNGAMPLPVLERHIEWFIRREKGEAG